MVDLGEYSQYLDVYSFCNLEFSFQIDASSGCQDTNTR